MTVALRTDMLTWDIYEISSSSTPLIGVGCRGRLRKYAMEQEMDLLTENASDAAKGEVRFAVLCGTDIGAIKAYLKGLFPDVCIACVGTKVPNPVLSKLKVNDHTRYET